MAREVPAAPKVYTTTYDNFKGVDFTNDATNVWRRRSPTGVNMLPDASGRPFKRHGWNILLSNADICTALGQTDCQIEKCSYFELAGVDHIVVFTNAGVLFYNGDTNVNVNGVVGITAVNTDYDCYTGFDRSFFFEGNGTSAFYIYGNFKVWRYESDFQLHNVTDIVTVPTVLISTSADGTGTFYNGYNLLGTKASIEYNDSALFTHWGTDGLVVTVGDAFKSKPKGEYVYTKASGQSWSPALDASITVLSIPQDGQGNDLDVELKVVYADGVLLPNNVSPSQASDVKVWTSASMQFDRPLEVITTGTPTASQCLLHYDTMDVTRTKAWLQFGAVPTSLVDGEDYIKVEFPSVSIVITDCDETSSEDEARLVGE